LENKHYVQIVIKNTSILDFSIPLLWATREKYPNSKITIFFAVINRKQILRDSLFFENFCRSNNIDIVELSDFLDIKSRTTLKYIRNIFKESYSDKISLKTLIKNNGKGLKSYFMRFLRPIEKTIMQFFLDKQFMDKLNPDYVLFDNRTSTSFIGRDEMYNYLEKNKIKTALLPHAPHYIYPTNEYCSFDEKNKDIMPKYVEHWMPFKFGKPWNVSPKGTKEQFIFTGYPGLDTLWKDYIYNKNNKKDNNLNILIMTRKFLSEGQEKKENSDPFTLTYDEVYEFYDTLAKSIFKLNNKIKVIIKSHPSSSKPELVRILEDVGFKNYEITYELFYDLLPKIDRVISQFTTSLVLPVSYKIPTLIFEDNLQVYVNDSWNVLKTFYSQLSFYIKDDELNKNIELFISNKSHELATQDYYHLRKYFDDDSINRCLNRMKGNNEKNCINS
jgi:hypothetical protein